ncbi:MAG: hypothetical protein ACE5R4_16300 [Armatimonadota bacterium]
MGVALSKEGSFGFALQISKGSYVAPDTWLPLLDAETVSQKHNYVFFDMADGNDFQSKYFSAGSWAEGALPLPLIPGSVSNLLSWIQDRDSDNQGEWASALIDCGNTVKQLTDAKVRRARIVLEKGKPALCLLEVVALSLAAGTPGTPAMPVAPPYIFREATVELETGGGGAAADANCERIEIVIDGMLEQPAEGMRLRDAANPLQLYNLSGVRCVGSFDRDFVDSGVYDDFLAGTESALTVTLTRDVNVCTVTLPRIVHAEDEVGLPGSAERRLVERVNFVALGSTDGATAPVILA